MPKSLVLRVKPAKNRIWELDYVRGALILLVTLDHVCVFLPHFLSPTNAAGELLLRIARDYYSLALRQYIQPFVVFLFAFLSGINSSFTRNHLTRVTSFGLLVSTFMLCHKFVTLLFPSFCRGLLIFNILAVLFICFVVWWLLAKIKAPKIAILLLGIALAALGMYFCIRMFVTDSYYVLPDNLKVFSLFIYSQQGLEWSIDNFEPLLPSLGFFLIGGVIGGALYKTKQSKIKHRPNAFARLVSVAGKHSLAVYIAGPVVVIGLLVIANILRII